MPRSLSARRLPDPTTALVWAISGIFLAGVVLALGIWISEAMPAISQFGTELITGKEWFFRFEMFGAASMIYASVIVSLIALILAAPVAIGAAIFISEYLPHSLRSWAKTAVEFLAAVPSVVYGLLGIIFLREWMAERLAAFDPLSGDMLATAGVLLAIMVLPTIATFTEDAIRSIPESQRSAARGLGLTRSQTILHVVLPQARPAIIGACLLGMGRALGETIAVFLVVGRFDNQFPEKILSPALLTEPGQTLTSKLGGPETHISIGDPLHWGAILSLGLILLILSAAFVAVGTLLRRSNKEAA
ncbi:MAG: phosphate ABC transporter permease subunit PstC [Luteolibacter sp.]